MSKRKRHTENILQDIIITLQHDISERSRGRKEARVRLISEKNGGALEQKILSSEQG